MVVWDTGWRPPSTTRVEFIVISAEASTPVSPNVVPTKWWMIAIKEGDRGSSEIETSARDQTNMGDAPKAITDPLAQTNFPQQLAMSQPVHTVRINSIGKIGLGVGPLLIGHSQGVLRHAVVRSEETRERAVQAGIELFPSIKAMASGFDFPKSHLASVRHSGAYRRCLVCRWSSQRQYNLPQ